MKKKRPSPTDAEVLLEKFLTHDTRGLSPEELTQLRQHLTEQKCQRCLVRLALMATNPCWQPVHRYRYLFS